MASRLSHWMIGQGLSWSPSSLSKKGALWYLKSLHQKAQKKQWMWTLPMEDVSTVVACLSTGISLATPLNKHAKVRYPDDTLVTYLFEARFGDLRGRVKVAKNSYQPLLPLVFERLDPSSRSTWATKWYLDAFASHLIYEDTSPLDVYDFLLEQGANPLSFLLKEAQNCSKETDFFSYHLNRKLFQSARDTEVADSFLRLEERTIPELIQLQALIHKDPRLMQDEATLSLLSTLDETLILRQRAQLSVDLPDVLSVKKKQSARL